MQTEIGTKNVWIKKVRFFKMEGGFIAKFLQVYGS